MGRSATKLQTAGEPHEMTNGSFDFHSHWTWEIDRTSIERHVLTDNMTFDQRSIIISRRHEYGKPGASRWSRKEIEAVHFRQSCLLLLHRSHSGRQRYVGQATWLKATSPSSPYLVCCNLTSFFHVCMYVIACANQINLTIV